MTQKEANEFFIKLRIKGCPANQIIELYLQRCYGCDIKISERYANSVFRKEANKPHSVIIGESIMKLQYAHAKAETKGDIASEINAASKIAEIHRKYVGEKEEKSNLGNPWKQG